MSRTYYLLTQLDPENEEFFVDDKEGISSLRSDYALFLHKAPLGEETKEQDL
jgi:hypothetical protein